MLGLSVQIRTFLRPLLHLMVHLIHLMVHLIHLMVHLIHLMVHLIHLMVHPMNHFYNYSSYPPHLRTRVSY